MEPPEGELQFHKPPCRRRPGAREARTRTRPRRRTSRGSWWVLGVLAAHELRVAVPHGAVEPGHLLDVWLQLLEQRVKKICPLESPASYMPSSLSATSRSGLPTGTEHVFEPRTRVVRDERDGDRVQDGFGPFHQRQSASCGFCIRRRSRPYFVGAQSTGIEAVHPHCKLSANRRARRRRRSRRRLRSRRPGQTP